MYLFVKENSGGEIFIESLCFITYSYRRVYKYQTLRVQFKLGFIRKEEEVKKLDLRFGYGVWGFFQFFKEDCLGINRNLYCI